MMLFRFLLERLLGPIPGPDDYMRSDDDGSHRPTETGAAHPETRYVPGAGATITSAAYAAYAAAADPGEGAGIEEIDDDLPILACKAAFLVERHGGGGFEFMAPIYSHVRYGVDADAECKRGYVVGAPDPWSHAAPDLGCTCGFYAVPPDKKPPIPATMEDWLPFLVLLLVELSGTVVEHEKGYRAEHQRVVEVRLPPCLVCGSPAERAHFRADGWVEAFDCGRHTVGPNFGVTRAQLAEALGVAVP